jgi:hypothetical protein
MQVVAEEILGAKPSMLLPAPNSVSTLKMSHFGLTDGSTKHIGKLLTENTNLKNVCFAFCCLCVIQLK